MPEQKRAVILVSGGLDSTTVLAMAQAQGYACYTLSFDYGQRTVPSCWRRSGCPSRWAMWSTRWSSSTSTVSAGPH